MKIKSKHLLALAGLAFLAFLFLGGGGSMGSTTEISPRRDAHAAPTTPQRPTAIDANLARATVAPASDAAVVGGRASGAVPEVSSTTSAAVDASSDYEYPSFTCPSDDSGFTQGSAMNLGKFDQYGARCTKTQPSWKGYHIDYFRVMMTRVGTIFQVAPGAHVWESGCGCGHILKALQFEWKANFVAGNDVSQSTVDFARKFIPPSKGTICRTPYESLKFIPDHTFDYAVSHGAFYYVENLKGACDAFAEMLRITRPGGGLWVGHMENTGGLFTALSRGIPHSFWATCMKERGYVSSGLHTPGENDWMGWKDGLPGGYSVFVFGVHQTSSTVTYDLAHHVANPVRIVGGGNEANPNLKPMPDD